MALVHPAQIYNPRTRHNFFHPIPRYERLQIFPRDGKCTQPQEHVKREGQLPTDLTHRDVRPALTAIPDPARRAVITSSAPRLPPQVEHPVNDRTQDLQQREHRRLLTLQPTLLHAQFRREGCHGGVRAEFLGIPQHADTTRIHDGPIRVG